MRVSPVDNLTNIGRWQAPQPARRIESRCEEELGNGARPCVQQTPDTDKRGKIKIVRREALLHGFTKCYQEGRYQDILAVANKLYADTLESSGEIMDFVDIARIKTEGGK